MIFKRTYKGLEALIMMRALAGLTRPEAAKKAGISHPFLFLIERGERGMSPETIDALAKAYGITARELEAAMRGCVLEVREK